MTDHTALKEAAEAAKAAEICEKNEQPYYLGETYSAFKKAASPSKILELLAEITELEGDVVFRDAEYSKMKELAEAREYQNTSLREQLRELREALDIIEQNCEASASSYEARIKTIHGVIRLYSKREEAG
jgi:DNA repair ATPase RecN